MSRGPDIVINEFSKYGINQHIGYLHYLFNKIFAIGYFPNTWAEGLIIPLHKKGDVNYANIYRGISLLDHLGKLFTHVLNKRLTTWAKQCNIYVQPQPGFRKNMGTVHNIFKLNGIIYHYFNDNRKLFVAWVDYRKVYDLVVRDN